MAGILATGFAPAVVGSGVLMPVRTIWRPERSGTEILRLISPDPSIRDVALAELIEWLKRENERTCGLAFYGTGYDLSDSA
jgi:hypothetical protein